MTEGVQSYKDLLVWQKGIQLVKLVYTVLQDFPKDEVFGLQSQMKRAAVSIPSNIAEGWGRSSKPNYIQFLRIARGSLFELETQLIIAKELGFVGELKFNELISLITEESKMLNAFIRTLSIA
ncbi:four helix bundle protein [Flavobacterium sp. D11R37]|uniref:four helix bundle protein n=1 Tax=Flavobacterium coralii TaxID=2838017 RepID=UPI001CA6F8F9|nr:four helix bundle protein [Flavobacterium coralii]MBY8963847.1 four helix bundle protein [Flavobacterium coralii]